MSVAMRPPHGEFASYCRAKYNPAIELLEARFTKHAFAPHYHDTYAIGIVDQGALTNAFRAHCPGMIAAGELMVIYPGEVHAGRSLATLGVAYRMMYIPARLLAQSFQILDSGQSQPTLSLRKEALNRSLPRQFARLHQTLRTNVSSRLEQESLLTSILAQLFMPPQALPRREEAGGRGQRWVEAARDYLAAHFMEDVSLSRLAGMASVSPFHFLRSFQREVGLSPHAYQTQLRIEQAKHLLAQNGPLPQIGVQVGFYDQSHFIKKFRALIGLTPGQYRAQFD